MDKPDGLFVITPDKGPAFVEQLAVEKFFGIGKKTAEKMPVYDFYVITK
mgnify:CR=1 FL=1